MDAYSGKRDVANSVTPRKGYNVTFKDAKAHRDQNAQYCNRTGCSGRIKDNSQKTKLRSSDKAKFSKSSFCSSNGNEIIGSSSRSSSVMTGGKDAYLDSKRKLPPLLEFDSSESSQSGDSEGSEHISSPSRNPARHYLGSINESGKVSVVEVGSSNVSSNTRSRKLFQCKSVSNNQDRLPSSVPSISKNSDPRPLDSSYRNRYGLRNMKCNSISDVIPPGSSSAESKSARKYVMKKRSSEGESSLSRVGRQTTAAASMDRHGFASTSGIYISDSRHGNCTTGENSSSAASVRTLRAMDVNNSRMRFSYRQNGRNSLTFREPAVSTCRFPDSGIAIDAGGPSSSQQFFASGSSSYSLSGSNYDNQPTMTPYPSAEHSLNYLLNRDAWQRCNMNGIAELTVLRYPQQVLALETSLFLGGLHLCDQHQDLRLDIENMSYEELLDLEERMGTVSTALSEEAILKCVRRSIYQLTPSERRVMGSGQDGDDIKCCICQEEYALGDKIGNLVECRHCYHVSCINLWLRLKNWCPICKAPAAASTQ